MPVTIQVNGTSLTLVHKFSNGISTATVPDVCKTPTPGGPVPMPYPNIAQSSMLSDGTTTVKGDAAMAANKGSKFAMSNGDEAGTVGGVKSNVFAKEATWILYSFDVKLDGANACRLTDPMYHNAENTVNMAGVIQQALIDALGVEAATKICNAVCQAQESDAERKQDEVAKAFIKEKKLWPVHTPTDKYILPEVTTTIPEEVGGTFETLLSETGRVTEGGAAAPMAIPKAMSLASRMDAVTTRWDFVQVIDPAKPATPGNIQNYIECKFPGDTLTDNQKLARQKMGPRQKKKVVNVTPKKCGCP